MKFETVKAFGENYWFSGVYKITEYHYWNGEEAKPYFHAYYIPPGNKNWGDYVGGSHAQYDKRLSFDQAKQLCIEHAKDYTPTSKQLKQAGIAQAAWAN